MESVEVSGKTVEGAIERALAQLGADRSEVEVVVLREPRAGFLGLGAEDALVRVVLLEPEEPPPLLQVDPVEVAQEILEEIVEHLQFQASVHRIEPLPGQSQAALEIRGEGLGLLIGRRGESLAALQFLLNLLLSRRLKQRAMVSVDVAGYHRRRAEGLRRLAQQVEEQVRSRGTPVTLEPMAARERRIIHLTLAGSTAVVTYSIGEGESRRVVVEPREWSIPR